MIKKILTALFLGLMFGAVFIAFLEGLSREEHRMNKVREYNCTHYEQAMERAYEADICN